jgi:hypothetical protein
MIKRNYPHPVLDPFSTDYPNCGIQFTATMYAAPTTYRFHINFDIGSDSLLAEIANGNAVYAVQLDCMWTNYRVVIKSSTSEFPIEIDEEKLRGVVMLRPFLIAEKAFTLASNEFDPLFSGMSFPVRKGYVLGWDNPQEFNATKEIDELKNISSILQIVRLHKDGIPVRYDLTGEKIKIFLAEKDFQAYSNVRKHQAYRNALMCMLALPALSYAITALQQDNGEINTRWARVIKSRTEDLRSNGNMEDDPLQIAQYLLDYPVSKALQGIISYEEQAVL